MDNTKNDIPDDEVEGSTETLNDSSPSLVDVIADGLDDIGHPREDQRAEREESDR